jgi:hypothetical protein
LATAFLFGKDSAGVQHIVWIFVSFPQLPFFIPAYAPNSKSVSPLHYNAHAGFVNPV